MIKKEILQTQIKKAIRLLQDIELTYDYIHFNKKQITEDSKKIYAAYDILFDLNQRLGGSKWTEKTWKILDIKRNI